MQRIRLEFPSEAVVHRHSLSVRITDMNYGRHLGHDALISLLHEARAAALDSLGVKEWDLGGYPSVVADLAVQYQGEARWPDTLIIETALAGVQRKALTVFHRVVRESDQRLIATARLNLLLVDIETGRPVSIPASVLALLPRANGVSRGDD